MFLKAGAVSLALLLASRVLGLARESVQAAAFGASGLGDVAVLLLTLPDWIAGLLASGALAYVLLPHWALQSPAQQAHTQRRVAGWLLGLGAVLGLLLWLLREPLAGVLASGLSPALQVTAAASLLWSALALPAALLAALWVTRLQHQRDFTGLYAANLVVNGVLIAALLLIARGGHAVEEGRGVGSLTLLGLFLLAAMAARLLWLGWRLRRQALAPTDPAVVGPGRSTADGPAMPRAPLWLWAALSAGLPLALPFAARSLASGAGEGALATFNYAWKLVELPLVLAVQLVATLAFPGITRALANGAHVGPQAGPQPAVRPDTRALQLVRQAFALAWALACAAAAALLVGAPAIVQLLFGWGRMGPDALAQVAAWGSVGAWGLLPQALTAVALTVLAALGHMRAAVAAYAMALAALLLLGTAAQGQGAWLMAALDTVFAGVALAVLWALRGRWQAAGHQGHGGGRVAGGLLPWRAMAAPSAALLGLALVQQAGWLATPMGGQPPGLAALALPAVAAMLVLAVSGLASAELRTAMKR